MNVEECRWGTNPSGADSDGNGIPDGLDTDGDGVADGVEIAQDSDPADASDGGQPGSRVPVPFYFGDHSESHSEKYQLTVVPVANSGEGTPPRSFSCVNAHYGECETQTNMLKRGWRYEVRLRHASTNLSSPDYEPFGFINLVNIVGVGPCNNPFYMGPYTTVHIPVAGQDDANRSSFGNHMYVYAEGRVFDACAGAELGIQENILYLRSIIDCSTDVEMASSFFCATQRKCQFKSQSYALK